MLSVFAFTAFADSFSSLSYSQINNLSTCTNVQSEKDKVRVEITNNGQKIVSIYRFDKGVLWTLMPDEKKYIETPLPKLSKPNSSLRQGISSALKGQTKVSPYDIPAGYERSK